MVFGTRGFIPPSFLLVGQNIVHAHRHTDTRTYTHIHYDIHTYTHTHTHKNHTHTYTHMYVFTLGDYQLQLSQIWLIDFQHTCTHAHTHMHHTHTHTHTQPPSVVRLDLELVPSILEKLASLQELFRRTQEVGGARSSRILGAVTQSI